MFAGRCGLSAPWWWSWSEWQDLNLRPPRPERGGESSVLDVVCCCASIFQFKGHAASSRKLAYPKASSEGIRIFSFAACICYQPEHRLGKAGALPSEQLPNKLHGFSTDLIVAFAFRSVLKCSDRAGDSDQKPRPIGIFWCCRSGLN
jgi:hypothetical protein